MLRLIDTQNALLSYTVRFLHGKEIGFEKVKALINQSTTSHLISTFSFLCNWLSLHIKDYTDHTSGQDLQAAFQLIGQINQKVPPYILLHNVYDLNWGMEQPHWLLHEFFEPINDRITRMRSYFKPFKMYDMISSLPVICQVEKKDNAKQMEPGLSIEKVAYPAYEVTLKLLFKRLITNHVPINEFKTYLEHPNSRIVLTYAIIDLLTALNETRNALHEELLFAFSSIFIYVYAFTATNDIDGQILCEYLQSQPFLSPFCLLGMINNIPSHLYLFNLLSPREITTNTSLQHDIEPSQYCIADLTNDTKLKPFIKMIPVIFKHYILSSQAKLEKEIDLKESDNAFFLYVHLSPTTLYIKMKSVLGAAREKQLTSIHVHSMGILLLRCIIFSLQRTLNDCAETKMFTTDFCHFVKTVFSVLSTAFVEQLRHKFFEYGQFMPSLADLSIRGAYLHLIPVIIRFSNIDRMIKYCLKAVKEPSIARSGRIMIAKLLQCDYPKISPDLIKEICECEDIFTILNYIDALTKVMNVTTFEEQLLIESQRGILVKKIGDCCTENKGVFCICSIKPQVGVFNELSNTVLSIMESQQFSSIMAEMQRLPKAYPDDAAFMIRFMSLSSCMESTDFVRFMTNEIIQALGPEPKYPQEPSKFELQPFDSYVITAQSLLGRLVAYNATEAAISLSEALIPFMKIDSAALHWITSFLVRYRPSCPIKVLENIRKTVSGLPYSDEYFNVYQMKSNKDKIFEICKILQENEMRLIQNPDVVNREYQSPYDHAFAFSICSLALSTLQTPQHLNSETTSVFDSSKISEPSIISEASSFSGASENNIVTSEATAISEASSISESVAISIAELLTEPIYNLSRVWQHRDCAVLSCAKLAASLDNDVAIKFYDLLMQRKNNDLALSAGRLFVLDARLDVLAHICRSAQKFIGKDSTKLDFFMKMVLPSFWRLRGSRKVAAALLEGLLKSVSVDMPRMLLENVIDSVAMIYSKLGLYEERKTLVSAASGFSPEMREVIASCLVISPENPSSVFTPSVPDIDNIDLPQTKKKGAKNKTYV